MKMAQQPQGSKHGDKDKSPDNKDRDNAEAKAKDDDTYSTTSDSVATVTSTGESLTDKEARLIGKQGEMQSSLFVSMASVAVVA